MRSRPQRCPAAPHPGPPTHTCPLLSRKRFPRSTTARSGACRCACVFAWLRLRPASRRRQHPDRRTRRPAGAGDRGESMLAPCTRSTVRLRPSRNGHHVSQVRTCPAFSKINGHCKHVAALLIAVRDQVRPPRAPQPDAATAAQRASCGDARGPTASALTQCHFPTGRGGGRRGRRARARAMQSSADDRARSDRAARRRTSTASTRGSPSRCRRSRKSSTAIEARPRRRSRCASSTPNARTPLLPSALLAPQSQTPTADRDAHPPARALRERGAAAGRHRGARRGRGRSCSPLLKGRRVILEPQMMELRFGDEPLRAALRSRAVAGRHQVVVKSSLPARRATRGSSRRRRAPGSRGARAGTSTRKKASRVRSTGASRRRRCGGSSARAVHPRADRRAPAAHRAGAAARWRSRSAPSCPSSRRSPTSSTSCRRSGCARAARSPRRASSLRAAYEDVEIDVRADGMTPPVIVKPPERGLDEARAVHPLRHRRPARRRRASSATSASRPTKTGNGFVARGDDAHPVLDRGHRRSSPRSGTSSSPTTSSTCRCAARRSARTRACRAASTGSRSGSRSRAKGSPSRRTSSRRCLAEGRRYVRLADGSFARLDAREGPRGAAAPGRDPRDRRRAGGQAPALAGGAHPGAPRAGRQLERQPTARRSSSRSSATSTRSRARRSRATSRRRSARTRSRASTGSGSSTRSAPAASSPTTWGSARRSRRIALLLAVKAQDEKAEREEAVQGAHRRADERGHQLAARDGQVRALAHARALARRRPQGARRRARGRRRRHHELRAPPPRRGAPREARLRYAILDEAQNIKNPLSRHRARRQAPQGRPPPRAHRHADREPPLRDLVDLRLRLARACSGRSTSSRSATRARSTPGDSKAAQRLRATIHPFILRRTKSEVAKDLPEKIETDRFCELTGEQAALYSAVLKEVRAQVMGEVERQGLATEPDPDPRRAHAAPPGGVRSAPARAAARVHRRGLGQARRAARARRRRASTAGTGCSSSASSCRCSPSSSSAMDEDGVAYEYLDGSHQGPPERVDELPARRRPAGLPHLAQGRRQRA